MLISIIIRTLNEDKYLQELLESIERQNIGAHEKEVIIIDSGSTDSTMEIAKKFKTKITSIKKADFTFGKSLNMGTDFSNGDIAVYISGHCVPYDSLWLIELINPIILKQAGYTYGKQIGRDTTKFSEERIFTKYFPDDASHAQKGFFCNNANSAIRRDLWKKYKFNETITGLEDMDLAKRYYIDGGKIQYVNSAIVYHIHDESWTQTRRRYERESIALQDIMPEIQLSIFDTFRYIFFAITDDSINAVKKRIFFKEFVGIVLFRVAQFFGAYRGNHFSRNLSKERKEKYFFPK
tara:strand:- start:26395 stop:27276 length:882 start_codon:yes stop_codon:yes gene_type:complete